MFSSQIQTSRPPVTLSYPSATFRRSDLIRQPWSLSSLSHGSLPPRSVFVGDGVKSSIKTVNEINKVIGSVK